ncbi:MAG: LPS assembly lipoprotein LptE, partial [Verrucomicrobiia bacterium]
VTNAIIRRLENDGTYASGRSGGADAELTVRLTEFERVPTRRSRDDVSITTQYRAVLKAEVTLVNRVTGVTVMKDRVISGASEYIVQGDAVEAERQALPLVAQDLANRIVSAVAEGW